MKLFITNRQFQGEIEKVLEPIKQENEKLRDIIANKEYTYLVENHNLKIHLEQYKKILEEQEDKINKLKKEKKELIGAKGGLTKQINKLQDELEEANKKLSQRYILKELKPVRAKNTQKMKTKDSSKTSRIIKKVVDSNENK